MFKLLLAVGALGAAELNTKAEFEKAIHESGKGAFIKFLAPW